MNDESKAACVVGVLVVFVFGLICASAYSTEALCNSQWQREAIDRGVAGYDEQTGEWKWTVERKLAE